MIPFSARKAGLAALAVVALAAGCSSDPVPDATPAATPIPFADCAPLSNDQIIEAVHADSLVAHRTPQACLWDAQLGNGDAGISFSFTATESLQQLWDRARANGFETEHMIITQHALGTVTATAFYIRNPHDANDCAVAAASNGTITWRVQNRSRPAALDPCGAALRLTTMMVDLSP